MHRRITMVLEYKEPDYAMRKKIWDSFLQIGGGGDRGILSGKLQLSGDVDTSVLAIKYELTGGFIKNAVLSALLSALSRDRSLPVICQKVVIESSLPVTLTLTLFVDRISSAAAKCKCADR